ncbi:MAG: hypothetical protein HY077_10605, partial [Elusimicrobia bacterium]|nr:hypothetical protein [Elusimicrobiota bacterium]
MGRHDGLRLFVSAASLAVGIVSPMPSRAIDWCKSHPNDPSCNSPNTVCVNNPAICQRVNDGGVNHGVGGSGVGGPGPAPAGGGTAAPGGGSNPTVGGDGGG